jgi:hypothetical protein
MDYRIALYVHLLALVAASAASALAHLAQARMARAATPAEVAEWHAFIPLVARAFPLAVLTFAATGAYMVQRAGGFGWSAAWVQAGVVGVVLLMALGAVIGKRHGAASARLAASGARTADDARDALRDPVAGTLAWVNTAIGLSVTLVMVVKPGPIGAASVLACGIALGVAVARATMARAAAPAAKVALG